VDKEGLILFLGQFVTLVKDDCGVPFIVDGTIKEIYNSSILFHTNGKLIVIDFSRIKEVRPNYRGQYR